MLEVGARQGKRGDYIGYIRDSTVLASLSSVALDLTNGCENMQKHTRARATTHTHTHIHTHLDITIQLHPTPPGPAPTMADALVCRAQNLFRVMPVPGVPEVSIFDGLQGYTRLG